MLPEQGEYAYLATGSIKKCGSRTKIILSGTKPVFYIVNDSSAKPVIEANDTIREKGYYLSGSMAVFQTMNSTATMNLATIFKLRGVNFDYQCCLCQRLARHWSGLFYPQRYAGLLLPVAHRR